MMRSVGVLCCTLVILAGCGDDAVSSPDSSAHDASTSTTVVSITPPTTGVVAVDVPPCDLLTAEEVSSVSGLDVEEVGEVSPIACVFDFGTEAGVQVVVTVDDGEGRLAGPAAVFEAYAALIEDGEAEAVAGLGEGAVYAPGYRGLAVDAGGGRFIGLAVSGGFQHLRDPRDLLVQLATAALRHL